MPYAPRVVLLIESSREYGRGILRGVVSYMRTRQLWTIFHEERGLSDATPEWLSESKADGVIARADSPELSRTIQRLNIPVVDLRGLHYLDGVPLIETNDRVVVDMAFEHLTERRFTRFAFCGFSNANYSARRLKYLREIVSKNNLDLEVFGDEGHGQSSETVAVESAGLLQNEELKEWISSLVTPTGVICCNDIRARQVLAAAKEVGLRIPDELAVVGVDNDEIICGLCDPPLTSVEPDTERIGFRAAELLADMMNGQPAPRETEFVDPIRVVTRKSSDVLIVDDEDVAEAIRFIREHAYDGITVDDVVKALPISRTVLEKRFAKHLETSPKAEINRLRLVRIKQLLLETDDNLSRIAAATGFRHSEYLSSFFRQKTGETPGSYRKRKTLP